MEVDYVLGISGVLILVTIGIFSLLLVTTGIIGYYCLFFGQFALFLGVYLVYDWLFGTGRMGI